MVATSMSFRITGNMKLLKIYLGWIIVFCLVFGVAIWLTNEGRYFNEKRHAVAYASSNFHLKDQANFKRVASEENNTEDTSLSRISNHDTITRVITKQSQRLPLFTKEYLETVAPEIFNRVPEHFLPEYRNPCWLENGTLWCLPYFYIIGFHKCGTTDLFDKLLFHPSVLKVGKEPHWWAIRRLGLKKHFSLHADIIKEVQALPGAQDVSSFAWYLNWFKYQTVAHVQGSSMSIKDSNGTPKTFHPKVFGDGSVSTLTRVIFEPWDKVFPGGEDPDLLPYLMHAIQPQAKIIITLRDPVSRFKSMYYRKFAHGSSPTSLHQYAVLAVRCATKCLKKSGVRHCAYFSHCQNLPQIYLGIYVAFIKHWATVYGLENMLILRMEDKLKHPVSEFRKVLNYLELENLSDAECERIMNTKVFNQNKAGHQEMLNETKALLREFYKPFNKQLATFMNDEIYLFGY